MENHGKLYRVNVVLAVILGILVLVDILTIAGALSALKSAGKKAVEEADVSEAQAAYWEEGDNPGEYYQKYDLLTVEAVQAELLGTEWQGKTAEEGYRYYQVTIQLKNQGTREKTAGYLGIYLDGAGYEDVITEDKEITADKNALESNAEGIIPAGQTGVCQEIVKVRDGVDSITVRHYGESAEPEEYTIDLR